MIEVPNPGAGNQWVFQPPQLENEWRYKVLSVCFMFATDATVAGREVGLRYYTHAGPTDWMLHWYVIGQQQSWTRTYMLAINFPASYYFAIGGGAIIEPNNHRYGTMPDVEFTNLSRLASMTLAMQAADVYTDIRVSIRRWLDQRD